MSYIGKQPIRTALTSSDIEDGVITAAKIEDGAVVAAEIASNAVTTAKINADAVTGAKIADDAINSEHYTDGSVDTAHIADANITKAKLADSVDIFAGTSLSAADLGAGVHIKTADSGASVNAGHDEIVAEGSGNSGISILSGTSSNGAVCFGDSGNNCIGYVNYDHTNNKIDLGTNGATQWSLDSSGNFLPAATDHGIYLGVTSATAANLLNDYEEGTFTPIYRTTGNQLSSVTYNAWTGGKYTKVGQLVTVTAAIASNAVTVGSPSGNLRIGGLPFTVAANTGSTLNARGAVVMANQSDWGTNHTPNNGNVINGSTEFDLAFLYGNNDDVSSLASTDILTGSNTGANRLFFTVTYMTDA